jgi:hypothetical protein
MTIEKSAKNTVTVKKLDLENKETWRYKGRVLARDEGSITLEAFFDREDMHFHGIFLGKGDRFVETYYTNRWYNVFEIHARENDRLRGWYCNISLPANIHADVISYTDLALDLLVFPDGRQITLDEEEFKNLDLTSGMRESALSALEDIKNHFNKMLLYGNSSKGN